MAIAQDAFFIPEDIATGLATGLYRRIGSVVRYAAGPNKGQIVKHLKPIDLEAAGQARGVGARVLQLVKGHKKGAIIVGVTLAGAGAYVYNKVKNHEPKVVTEFHASLRIYIDAIRNGNMDVKKINSLMNSLEQLKNHKDYIKISIQLTTEELEILVGRIYDYTIKLANDNNVEFDEFEDDELKHSRNCADAIINLQLYLKAQKRIFEEVA